MNSRWQAICQVLFSSKRVTTRSFWDRGKSDLEIVYCVAGANLAWPRLHVAGLIQNVTITGHFGGFSFEEFSFRGHNNYRDTIAFEKLRFQNVLRKRNWSRRIFEKLRFWLQTFNVKSLLRMSQSAIQCVLIYLNYSKKYRKCATPDTKNH